MSGTAATLGPGLATSVVVFVLGWLVSLRVGRVNVVDTVWGLSFVAITIAALASSDGDASRRALLLVLVSCWGLRLAVHLGVRSRGAGEDPRYAAVLARWEGRSTLVRVFLVQAVIAWFVALPLQVGVREQSRPSALAVVGAALWLVGFVFETVGDAQLAAFKKDPRNRGNVLDRGLWRYTRHPNYFGEACLWFGLYLVVAQELSGALTVLSPVAMTWFVAAKTGKPLLEAQLSRTKPGYREYVARTSGFLPLPPKRG